MSILFSFFTFIAAPAANSFQVTAIATAETQIVKMKTANAASKMSVKVKEKKLLKRNIKKAVNTLKASKKKVSAKTTAALRKIIVKARKAKTLKQIRRSSIQLKKINVKVNKKVKAWQKRQKAKKYNATKSYTETWNVTPEIQCTWLKTCTQKTVDQNSIIDMKFDRVGRVVLGHNYAGAAWMLEVKKGERVIIHNTLAKGVYEVVSIGTLPKNASTYDIPNVSNSPSNTWLQTCEWNSNLIRFVGLEKIK